MKAKEFINGTTLPNENSLGQPITQTDDALRNFWNWSKVSKVVDEDDGQYQGSHTAPDRGQGSPLHDLSSNGIFPDDLYSVQGLRYYGNGSQEDAESYRIAMTYHNKPNALVTIYRSVPNALKGLQKKISTLEKQKAMYMSRGKIPRYQVMLDV